MNTALNEIKNDGRVRVHTERSSFNGTPLRISLAFSTLNFDSEKKNESNMCKADYSLSGFEADEPSMQMSSKDTAL